DITANCICPTATRTVPVYDTYSGITWNMTINTSGEIELIYQSGPTPQGGDEVRVSGTYDQLVDLFYNYSFPVTGKNQNCPAGEVDGTAGVTLVVPPYQFYSTTAQDAYNQAYNYWIAFANGDAEADACQLPCSFTYGGGLVTGYTNPNNTITASGHYANFTFMFTAN